VVILASTLLTLAYFARILERMFFREPGESAVAPTTLSLGMQATVVAAVVAAVLLGAAAFEYGQLLEPTVDSLLT